MVFGVLSVFRNLWCGWGSKRDPDKKTWKVSDMSKLPDQVPKNLLVGREKSAQSFLASSFSKSGTSRPKSRDIPATPCLKQQKKATCMKFLSGMSRRLGPGCPRNIPPKNSMFRLFFRTWFGAIYRLKNYFYFLRLFLKDPPKIPFKTSIKRTSWGNFIYWVFFLPREVIS